MLDVEKTPVAYFVYDLEFIGDINVLSSCRIWDISIACVDTGETFNAIVEPDSTLREIPPPVVDGLFPLTRLFLEEHHVVAFKTAWEKMVDWVNARRTNPVVLISHNNFLSDKPILEQHIVRHQAGVPSSWFLYDSLHYFRDNYKTYDYSLKGLAKSIMYRAHDHAHRARADTIMLTDCLEKHTNGTWHLNGFAYPLFVNSLRCIRGIGQTVEAILLERGFTNENELLSRANLCIQHDLFAQQPLQKSLNFMLLQIFYGVAVPVSTVQTISNTLLNNFKRTQLVNNIFN